MASSAEGKNNVLVDGKEQKVILDSKSNKQDESKEDSKEWQRLIQIRLHTSVPTEITYDIIMQNLSSDSTEYKLISLGNKIYGRDSDRHLFDVLKRIFTIMPKEVVVKHIKDIWKLLQDLQFVAPELIKKMWIMSGSLLKYIAESNYTKDAKTIEWIEASQKVFTNS